MEAGLSKSRVEANMRRWQGKGVDPHNPDHVSAYLLARQTSERPKLQHVLNIINGKTTAAVNKKKSHYQFLLGAAHTPEP